jgi:single-stranded DNA-binding protein
VDLNVVVLTGRLVSAAERAVGQTGRTLTELRLGLARAGRKGEAEQPTVVPITIWDYALGVAVRELAEGTPVTVVGRISAREWTSPSGQARTFVEVVGETVTVDVAAGGPETPAPSANAEAPAPARRPRSAAPRASADDVPF